MKQCKELFDQYVKASYIMRTAFTEKRASEFLFGEENWTSLPGDIMDIVPYLPIYEIEFGIKADSINRACDETYRRTKYSY